jgi:hypothetical protein
VDAECVRCRLRSSPAHFTVRALRCSDGAFALNAHSAAGRCGAVALTAAAALRSMPDD